MRPSRAMLHVAVWPLCCRVEAWGDVEGSLLYPWLSAVSDTTQLCGTLVALWPLASLLIKGNTGCLASLDLLSHVSLQFMRLDLFVWVTRVPSQSNLSDGPSRGDYANVLSVGGVEVCARLPEALLPAVACDLR